MKVTGNKLAGIVDSVVVTNSPVLKPEISQKPVTVITDKVRVTTKNGDIQSTGITFFNKAVAVDNTYVAHNYTPFIFTPGSVKTATISSFTGKTPATITHTQKNTTVLGKVASAVTGSIISASKSIVKVEKNIIESVTDKLFHPKKDPAYDAGSFIDLAKKEAGDYIFLFNTRSSINIDWSTPTDLSITTGLSGLSKKLHGSPSAIGHAQVGWVSNDGKGHIISGGAGQSGQHGGEGATVAMNGWGLNVLQTVFLDGALESRKDVLDKTQLANDRKSFSWMAIKTDHQTLMKMVNFIQEYDKSGAARNYGFSVDPLKFEGAGCTSFASAAFFKTGLNLPIFEGSKRQLNLPLEYFGKRMQSVPNTRAPELASRPEDEKKVSFVNMLVNKVKWASESEPHKKFEFYDPELYFESLVNMENVVRKDLNMEPKSIARTEKTDAAQYKAQKISETWIEDLIQKNVPVKMGLIHNTSGLVIDLSAETKEQKAKK